MIKRNIFIIIVFFIFNTLISPQSITVTEPDPGDIWYKGSTYDIKWTSSGCTDNSIKINIFKNSVLQSNFVEQLTSNDTGSKSWTIPSSYANGNYIIRIKTSDNNCTGDSGIFHIAQPEGSITVTEPDPGETWYKGLTYDIKWTSSGCSDNTIKINIFKNSIIQSNFVEQLASSDTGSKSWFIPANYVNGNYIMRIKTSDSNCIGDSGLFVISNNPGSTPPPISATLQTTAPKIGSQLPRTGILNQGGPDLYIKSIKLSPEEDIYTVTRVKLTCIIGNKGNVKSIYTVARLSHKHASGSTSGGPTRQKDVKILTPGATTKVSFYLYSINNKLGWYTATINVDPGGTNEEGMLGKLNNKKSAKYYVQPPERFIQCITQVKNFRVFSTLKNNGYKKMSKFWAFLYVKIPGTQTSTKKVSIIVPEIVPGQIVEINFPVHKLLHNIAIHPILKTLSVYFETWTPMQNHRGSRIKFKMKLSDLFEVKTINKCVTYIETVFKNY